MRYRLQCKEPYAIPNILGNHSFPVHSYRWVDKFASDDKKALENIMQNKTGWRIIDTLEAINE